MFEKDAKEYYNGQYDAWLEGEDSFALEEEIEQAFKDGAEFGYNKSKEWHYVKNGLPTNTGLYLIFYYNSFFNDKVRCIARYSPDRKEFLNIDIRDGDEVIAWQELPVPPKESE